MKKEITKDVFFCDRCDKELEEEEPVGLCAVCGKDLCLSCADIVKVRVKPRGVRIQFTICATPSYPADAFPEGYHKDAFLHAQRLLPDLAEQFCDGLRAAEEVS